MFELFRRIKWLYQKFQVSVWLPFVALLLYTFLGAFIFIFFEREFDEKQRLHYRNQTSYALDQVLDRMLEVKCHDELIKADRTLQVQHAKEALVWFLDHLNLTKVIDERTDESPWTFLIAMFYAGQLYTTIGYGYPTTQTTAGRVASIFYILIGIPIFLIILKDMGRLLSRSLRKLYKRLRTSKRKIESASLKVLGTKALVDGQKPISPAEMELQNKENARRHAAENNFPISIALVILLLWILLSASLFCLWEQHWGFVTSVYFFFVSISTVGLGDIVFTNRDMMIYNFMLILIGLALLSMCFNLIQAALERMLNRLLEEYIEEIEKMAEIVANDDCCDEEAIPIEFKMTGNLLTLPMKRVTHDSGFLAEAKGWMAGRIANNLLASRLGNESESDSEEDKEAEEEPPESNDPESPNIPSARHMSDASASKESRRGSLRRVNNIKMKSGRLNAVRTLDKIKTHKGDFRSMVFSKFLESDRLGKLVEDAGKARMVTTGCQTEPAEENDNVKWRRRFKRKESCGSFSTIGTNSVLVDDESLLSSAYCDLKFDYSTEVSSPPSQMRSTLSIMKMEDEEPLLPSRLTSMFGTWNPVLQPWKSPQLRVNTNLAAVRELPSPTTTASPLVKSPLRKYPSTSDLSSSSKTEEEDGLEKVRKTCGLLPKDFDTYSSRSTLVDSGYERSQHDEKKLAVESIAEDVEYQNEIHV